MPVFPSTAAVPLDPRSVRGSERAPPPVPTLEDSTIRSCSSPPSLPPDDCADDEAICVAMVLDELGDVRAPDAKLKAELDEKFLQSPPDVVSVRLAASGFPSVPWSKARCSLSF